MAQEVLIASIISFMVASVNVLELLLQKTLDHFVSLPSDLPQSAVFSISGEKIDYNRHNVCLELLIN
jgi:hypothetical protein